MQSRPFAPVDRFINVSSDPCRLMSLSQGSRPNTRTFETRACLFHSVALNAVLKHSLGLACCNAVLHTHALCTEHSNRRTSWVHLCQPAKNCFLSTPREGAEVGFVLRSCHPCFLFCFLERPETVPYRHCLISAGASWAQDPRLVALLRLCSACW